jgi:hypothetical protein
MSPLKGSDCVSDTHVDSRFVGFTTELLAPHQIKTLVSIFTIRDSVFESILAQAVSNYFVKTDEDWETFVARVRQPITLDPETVIICMHQHFSWYRHCVTLLDRSSFVVSYDIVSGMIAGNDRVDLEKIAVIKNLNEIKHLVISNIDSGTQMAIDEFYDRRCRPGSGDIYNILQLQ